MAPHRSNSRYLVTWLPGFRWERCGWQAADRVVLVGERRGILRVLATTPAASAAGVRPGMNLPEARALRPDLQAERLDAEGERRDLLELSRQLWRVSPLCQPLIPDAIAAEIESERTEQRMQAVRERMRFLGHRARLVVADDIFGARLLAAWSSADRIIPPGGLRSALAPLPLEALERPWPLLPPELAGLFRDLGLRTMGDLAALPTAAVLRRFGPCGTGLHALARGEGLGPPEPMDPDPDPADSLAESCVLPFPVEEVEPLFFVLQRLLRNLADKLDRAGQALVRLSLDLDTEEGSREHFSFRMGRPLRDPERMGRMVRIRLEGVRLAAPAIRVRVAAEQHAPFSGVQIGLLAGEDSAEPFEELVARLLDALGTAALVVPCPQDSWRPEAAWIAGSADTTQEASSIGSRGRAGTKDDPTAPHEAWQREIPLFRPALLLAEPRHVEIDETLSPAWIRIEGRRCAIRRVRGPERLEGEWWAHPFARAYWILDLDDGRHAWIYKESGHSFLHGWFDQGVQGVTSARALHVRISPANPLPELTRKVS